MKPVLKWVGGKTQILDEVFSMFPSEMVNYHEPFLGGGSVLLELLTRAKSGKINITGKVYASDLNENLINFYKNVQSQLSKLIVQLTRLVEEWDSITGQEVNRQPSNIEEASTSKESYYYWVRSQFNSLTAEERRTPRASALFLFLNKTCFRGVYREGPNGFNVPFGNYKNPSVFDKKHLKELSGLIKDCVFTHQDFVDSLKLVKKDDFVYLDPPYAPETETSFVSYTVNKFTLENHTKLFDILKGNIKFLMSNSDVPLVKNAFPSPEFTTKVITCRRAIHSKNPETKTNEVLIAKAE